MFRKLAYGASVAVLAMAASSAAFAQETTGGLRGQVTDENGAPVANATVTIIHEPTGTVSRSVTSEQGIYSARNLRPGGPYTVTAEAPGFASDPVRIASIGVGDPAELPITAWSATAVAEVVVTGVSPAGLQTGPRTRIGREDIDTLPSISRDIRDFARTSPFVTLDQSNADALSVGGFSNRVNALYVDGIRQGDDFGLQANGYPGQRSPFSISTVQAVNIEVAPFDVQYGFFQGGLINVVTRGGGNEFSGELFYEYTDNSLRGEQFSYTDAVTGANRDIAVTSTFEERSYGATFSGPIIQDRLFFLVNYEYFEGLEPSIFGPSGSGAPSEINGITVADAENVRNIVQTNYGFDPLGATVSDIETIAEQYLVRLDWNINEDHRATFSYQHTEDSRLNQTGNSTSATAPSLGLLSKYYTLATELDVYRFQLFSDWTDNFSTEIAIGRKEVVNDSQALGGNDFAQFQVYLPGTVFNATTGAAVCTAATPCRSIFLGPDVSRQANQLTNDLTQYRFRGTYQAGDHRITFGFEREELEIFNLFVQNANGTYVFNSLADLAAGNAYSLTYANAPSNVTSDGAAQFGYNVNTWYIQDEYDFSPSLTLRFGLRLDQYGSDDRPLENPAFEAAYGFSNTENLDGRGVLQPRFGFTWTPDELTTIYGGAGLFAGGSPNVWISNNYSNTGNSLGFVSCNINNQATNCPGALIGVDGFDVAPGAETANTNSANLGTGNINVLDPNFEIPSVWKFSLGIQRELNFGDWGFTRFLGDGWNARAEVIASDTRNGVDWVDLLQEDNLIRSAPDGRPVYGPRANQQVLMLTNTQEGQAFQWAVGIGREWYDGWFEGLAFDLSYTHLDSQDVQPGTSSVAASNYRQVATATPNNLDLATSNYEFEESWKLDIGYSRAFFGDYRTRFRLFGQRRSGLPFSYTFDENTPSGGATGLFGENSGYTNTDRQLLYVPQVDPSTGLVTATSDPIVRFGPSFNLANFNAFLQNSGLIDYAGEIAPRNAFQSESYTTFDLRIAQELPAFFPGGARLEAYMDIENLGNMINDEWGVLQQTGFPYFQSIVTAQNCQVTACSSAGLGNFYEYTGFSPDTESSVSSASVWQVKFGVRYRF